MINLYHEDNYYRRNFIGKYSTEVDATRAALAILKNRGINYYYLRVFTENGETILDYGSHSEFFILKKG